MKLLLRRDQRKGYLGGTPTFQLVVRAELSSAERTYVTKLSLSDFVLYDSHEITDPGSGLLGLGSRLLSRALSLTITVSDLDEGRVIDCRSIAEMLHIEAQILEAAGALKALLETASTFGREVVVEV